MDLEIRIIEFVSEMTSIRVERLFTGTRLQWDCGVDGDDASELMVEFSRRFSVDLSDFRFDRYFGPEAAFNPFASRKKLVAVTIGGLVWEARKGKWGSDLGENKSGPGTWGEAGPFERGYRVFTFASIKLGTTIRSATKRGTAASARSEIASSRRAQLAMTPGRVC